MFALNMKLLNLLLDFYQEIRTLQNVIEKTKSENAALRAELQQLRDENNRLKGEQAKPDIKPNKKEVPPSEAEPVTHSTNNSYSSESQRLKESTSGSRKKSKRDQIKIDREVLLDVDPNLLPQDAQFKGYQDVIVQDVKIQTDNVCFKKAKYYSPSTGKTYLAELPAGYQGQFGPSIRAFSIILYFMCNMTEPKILELFSNIGCDLSAGQLSNFLIKGQDDFHHEKEQIYQAGLASTPWAHIDDTATRVNGVNQHAQIICNPFYTIYFTTEKKDRLSIIDTLLHNQERIFLVNQDAINYLIDLGLAKSKLEKVKQLPHEQEFNEREFICLLSQEIPDLGPIQQKWILEAAYLAYYHTQSKWPVVNLLICDDAPQFKKITDKLALCWIHDARHYNKLNPYVAYHRQLLDGFMKRYWLFYRDLNEYRQSPDQTKANQLESQFSELFSTSTGYDELDKRISKTLAKKEQLLMVLTHPEILLHNNPAELAARQRVRKRVISVGPRSDDGRQAWDTFMSLVDTTKKLGISFFHYVHDRIKGEGQIPPLIEIIEQFAQESDLSASFDSSSA